MRRRGRYGPHARCRVTSITQFPAPGITVRGGATVGGKSKLQNGLTPLLLAFVDGPIAPSRAPRPDCSLRLEKVSKVSPLRESKLTSEGLFRQRLYVQARTSRRGEPARRAFKGCHSARTAGNGGATAARIPPANQDQESNVAVLARRGMMHRPRDGGQTLGVVRFPPLPDVAVCRCLSLRLGIRRT
jgi:hypothetical protein